MSALRLINETTISSNVQSVNVSDVFSSTYDAYKIVGTGFLLASSGGTNINLRLIDSSDNVISSGYVLAIHNLKSGGSFTDNNRGTSKDNIFFYFGRAGASGQSTGTVGYIFNPYSSSHYTFSFFENVYNNNNINQEGAKGVFTYPQNTSITGFQAYASSNIAAGTIQTYGLKR